MMSLMSVATFGQRKTDVLDRGLIAVKTTEGVYCSWRIPAEEYYDVEYNLYRNGVKVNEKPLSVSNYVVAGGSETDTYTVKAVVKGVEEVEESKPASVWKNSWLDVKMNHGDLKSTYIPNDACLADVDGDGELEILLKFDNQSDASQFYNRDGYEGEYAIMEIYKLDGTKLWWIDLGPNMADFQNNEQNIVAFDWDEDGNAEVVMRAADGTKIHTAKGETIVIGDPTKNYRWNTDGDKGQWFVHDGAEFLLYLNGETGEVYDQMDYPLRRLEEGEGTGDAALEKAWGDGYGHRSTKHFFGAPFLDGKHASIFLARGIYTRHKMVALDVDRTTHKLSERWRWTSDNKGGEWYGNGFHNYMVADVDWDGRDEICFGSMVIDDNGNGLSTTGLGHGDAQHCSDLDPFTHGQEIFTCLEDHPGNNLRDATTSKIYYRYTAGKDDGRSMAGNFTDDYYGAQCVSTRDPSLIGAVKRGPLSGGTKNGIADNFRIYWDGDLCEETMDGMAEHDGNGAILKYKVGVIETLTGSMTNNWTKKTPCVQGDIFGDWREEVIMKTADHNIRIYTTTAPTPWRVYSLWHDHQYRNAMVWQMCGYNQPPHTSYFLGQKEGITVPPPPLTLTGRTVVESAISSANDGEHLLIHETDNKSVAVNGTVSPYMLTINTPTWVQGHDNNDNITTTTYTTTLTGEGEFTGDMRFVKQGDGKLNIGEGIKLSHTGETNIWAGEVTHNGDLLNSNVWINKFGSIAGNVNFGKDVTVGYDASLKPGGEGTYGTMTVADTLILDFGGRVEIDIDGGENSDYIEVGYLQGHTVTDKGTGLKYTKPVIYLNITNSEKQLPAGRHEIGIVKKEVKCNISDIEVQSNSLFGYTLEYDSETGKLYVVAQSLRKPMTILWVGDESNIWETANQEANLNFVIEETGEKTYFVPGDVVKFTDAAETVKVALTGELFPSRVIFDFETKTYDIEGAGSIGGEASVEKRGAGLLRMNAKNTYTGGTEINGGTLLAYSLAYRDGENAGSLGTMEGLILVNGGDLQTQNEVNCSQVISVAKDGSKLVVNGTLLLTEGIRSMASYYKTGSGTLRLADAPNYGELHIVSGTVQAGEYNSTQSTPEVVVFEGGTLKDANNVYSYSNSKTKYVVPAGKTGTWYVDSRCEYTDSVKGEGNLTIQPQGTRTAMTGNWSKYTGRVTINTGESIGLGKLCNLENATLNALNGWISNQDDSYMKWSGTMKVGALTGSGTLAGSNLWSIGYLGTNTKFTGTFASGAKFEKQGAGMLTLSTEQESNISGDIYVRGGILNLEQSDATKVMTMSTIRVTGEGSTLMGNAECRVVYVQNGGTLMPGKGTSTALAGALKFSQVNSFGGTLSFNIRNSRNTDASRSFITSSGSMMLDANTTIDVTMGSSYNPKAGDAIKLWVVNGSLSISDKVKVNLPELPEGLEWDTSELFTKTGTIKILATPTAVRTLSADTEVECEVYNLAGVKVAKIDAQYGQVDKEVRKAVTRQGLYIVHISGNGVNESKTVGVKK